jgi:hypothetical protein
LSQRVNKQLIKTVVVGGGVGGGGFDVGSGGGDIEDCVLVFVHSMWTAFQVI